MNENENLFRQKLSEQKLQNKGLEPWSIGYGRQLIFERSWI